MFIDVQQKARAQSVPLLARFAVVLVLLSACATTYKEFRTSKLKPGQGVAIGHIRVHYNGRPYTKQCSICFNSANGPCQTLTSEGLVFQALPVGTAALRRILCLDTSLQHHTIKHSSFVQPNGVVYFGDVTVEWKNGGGLKATALYGLTGALLDAAMDVDDGEIEVSVDGDDANQVIGAYREHVGEPKALVYQSLAEEPDVGPPEHPLPASSANR